MALSTAGAATLARPGTHWHELSLDEALLVPSACWEVDAAISAPFQRRDWFAAWQSVATAQERASAFALGRHEADAGMWYMLPLARCVVPVGSRDRWH